MTQSGISLVELIQLIALRSGPAILLGLGAQYFLLRQSFGTALSTGAASVVTISTGLLALAASMGFCLAFPALMKNLITLDLLPSLAFVPAWVGVALAAGICSAAYVRYARGRDLG